MLVNGMRPPKHLDKADPLLVIKKLRENIAEEVDHAKYRFTVDQSMEDWVAKCVLGRGVAFNGSTVSDFLEQHEGYAPEWGRRLTTANFNPVKSGLYTSYYTTEAHLAGLRTGHLSPILPADVTGKDFKDQVHRLAEHVGVNQAIMRSEGFDLAVRLRRAMDRLQERIDRGEAIDLGDELAMDEYVYTTDRAAYDVDLSERPPTLDDVTRLNLPSPPPKRHRPRHQAPQRFRRAGVRLIAAEDVEKGPYGAAQGSHSTGKEGLLRSDEEEEDSASEHDDGQDTMGDEGDESMAEKEEDEVPLPPPPGGFTTYTFGRRCISRISEW